MADIDHQRISEPKAFRLLLRQQQETSYADIPATIIATNGSAHA